jgi:hypothetical protein
VKPEHVEPGPTMGHESLLRLWFLNTYDPDARHCDVNNVSLNHS